MTEMWEDERDSPEAFSSSHSELSFTLIRVHTLIETVHTGTREGQSQKEYIICEEQWQIKQTVNNGVICT